MAEPLDDDARHALRLVPAAREIMAFTRAQLPAGTHIGIMILEPLRPGETAPRVVALTTDRETVALGVARWAVEILGEAPRG